MLQFLRRTQYWRLNITHHTILVLQLLTRTQHWRLIVTHQCPYQRWMSGLCIFLRKVRRSSGRRRRLEVSSHGYTPFSSSPRYICWREDSQEYNAFVPLQTKAITWWMTNASLFRNVGTELSFYIFLSILLLFLKVHLLDYDVCICSFSNQNNNNSMGKWVMHHFLEMNVQNWVSISFYQFHLAPHQSTSVGVDIIMYLLLSKPKQ